MSALKSAILERAEAAFAWKPGPFGRTVNLVDLGCGVVSHTILGASHIEIVVTDGATNKTRRFVLRLSERRP